MNKKTILIILLAGILALIGAFAIFKYTLMPTPLQPIEQEEELTPVAEVEPVVEEKEDKKEEKAVEKVQKPAIVQPVKKVSYRKPEQQPAKIEEPVIKPITVQEIVPTKPEPIQNEGVLKEENSGDVVITREYKMESPSRYTFK